MSKWRHGKLLLGTCMCWFLLDIAYVSQTFPAFMKFHPNVHRFYGINLNQNVVLQQIGFDGSVGTPWENLFKIATGNIIVTALGFVPGNLSDFYIGARLMRFVPN